MKDFLQLKKPPDHQIKWFKSRFEDNMNLWEGIEKFYLTEDVISACVGEKFRLFNYNGSDDLPTNFHLELTGGNTFLAETIIIFLGLSIHDAEDVEYYEIAGNVKCLIDILIKSSPEIKKAFKELPTRRIFSNPNFNKKNV